MSEKISSDPAPPVAQAPSTTDSTEKGLEKNQGYDTEKAVGTDEESGRVGQIHDEEEQGFDLWAFIGFWWKKLRWLRHLLIWILFTVWFGYGVGVYHEVHEWLKPFLFWLALTLRIITAWVPARYAMVPVKWIWERTVLVGYNATPKKLHKPIAAVVTIAVFLIGSMIPKEDGMNTRAARAQSIFGLLVMIFIMTVTSKSPKYIPWHTVIAGMLSQFVLAVFVLKTEAGFDIFKFISFLAQTLLGFAREGVSFLTTPEIAAETFFFLSVIPAIIFFVALVSMCFHYGLIQWFIGKFAVFFFWSLRVSGAEAVVAAATPFIGQGESAMLIRPFVAHLTMAELHQVMTCGFATIAGSVLVAYIGMGLNPQALVSSCIMSIPASLAISKMRYPEREETLTSGKVVVPEDTTNHDSNGLEAFANGAWLGLKIAGMIVSTLLCIIAFVGMVNGFLGWWAMYWGMYNPNSLDDRLTLELILGYLFYPVAWLLGVPEPDLLRVGKLIGMKIIINEYAAFDALVDPKRNFINMLPRSKLIATYACCGFGNIGSLGTQIGVLTQIAPNRSSDVSKVAVSALVSGVIATLSSASVAGMLATDSIIESITGAGAS